MSRCSPFVFVLKKILTAPLRNNIEVPLHRQYASLRSFFAFTVAELLERDNPHHPHLSFYLLEFGCQWSLTSELPILLRPGQSTPTHTRVRARTHCHWPHHFQPPPYCLLPTSISFLFHISSGDFLNGSYCSFEDGDCSWKPIAGRTLSWKRLPSSARTSRQSCPSSGG